MPFISRVVDAALLVKIATLLVSGSTRSKSLLVTVVELRIKLLSKIVLRPEPTGAVTVPIIDKPVI